MNFTRDTENLSRLDYEDMLDAGEYNWATTGVWFNWRAPSAEGGHPLGPAEVRVMQCRRRMNLLEDLELPFYVEKRRLNGLGGPIDWLGRT